MAGESRFWVTGPAVMERTSPAGSPGSVYNNTTTCNRDALATPPQRLEEHFQWVAPWLMINVNGRYSASAVQLRDVYLSFCRRCRRSHGTQLDDRRSGRRIQVVAAMRSGEPAMSAASVCCNDRASEAVLLVWLESGSRRRLLCLGWMIAARRRSRPGAASRVNGTVISMAGIAVAAAGPQLGPDGAAERADDHGQSKAQGRPTCGVSRGLGGTRNVDPASRVAQIAELSRDVGE
jgi:hypothetical protein